MKDNKAAHIILYIDIEKHFVSNSALFKSSQRITKCFFRTAPQLADLKTRNQAR
jgi:hypothetical protein